MENKTQIFAPIFEDAEGFLKENLKDFFVDGVSAVYPVSKFDDNFSRTYFDEEEEKELTFDFKRHVDALILLVKMVNAKQLFVGGITSAIDLTEPCNWDIEVVDAYFQLIYHGEVIYG